jgi:NADP-dependent 3-hydroxy acid dehydrogenase YdfG
MHNPRPLSNNTVLITGAASGIGRSLSRRLSEQGASLALIDRDGGALDDLARELEMARVRFRVAVADVRDRPGLGQAVDALVRELGPIDILVASAGVCGISLVDDLKVEQVEEFFKVNFLGVVYAIDCVLPSMLLRKRGQIVGIASLAAIGGLPL